MATLPQKLKKKLYGGSPEQMRAKRKRKQGEKLEAAAGTGGGARTSRWILFSFKNIYFCTCGCHCLYIYSFIIK